MQKETQPAEPTSRVQSKAGATAEAVSGDDTVMADAADVAVKVGSPIDIMSNLASAFAA